MRVLVFVVAQVLHKSKIGECCSGNKRLTFRVGGHWCLKASPRLTHWLTAQC